MTPRWIDTFDLSYRDAIYAAMRDLNARALDAQGQAFRLVPPNGTVRSEGFDLFLKGAVLFAYVYALRDGKSPEEAHVEACQAGRRTVEHWNTVVCPQHAGGRTARDIHAGDGYADFALRFLRQNIPQAFQEEV